MIDYNGVLEAVAAWVLCIGVWGVVCILWAKRDRLRVRDWRISSFLFSVGVVFGSMFLFAMARILVEKVGADGALIYIFLGMIYSTVGVAVGLIVTSERARLRQAPENENEDEEGEEDEDDASGLREFLENEDVFARAVGLTPRGEYRLDEEDQDEEDYDVDGSVGDSRDPRRVAGVRQG